MASLNKDLVIRNLTKKGFVLCEGDHHYLHYVTLDGKKTGIRTKISHGSHKDITSGLVSAMATQCKLTTHDFVEFAKCHIDQNQYEAKLTAGNYLPRSPR
ncbi:MAG: hypothetical protein ACI38S_02280 [Atopobiaceae bacterium]|uniref:hypothetical protein n=1 Tax=Olsenella sp. AGMB03486 TaxID=3230364 RepID=UPI0034A07B2D